MKRSVLLLMSIWSLGLLNGCGTTTPPPVATHFSVSSATPSPTAGTAFNITVTALDASNSVVVTYSGTVHFTSSDAPAVLPASATIASGAGTGSGTLKTPGNQTVTATGPDLLTGTARASPVGAPPGPQICLNKTASTE